MNIILFGPPGAGKGTQADNLVKDFNLYKISSGDLLRNEIKKNTAFSNKIKSIIDEGLFVSDDLINNLINNFLDENKFNSNFIFDGYPRNINQAKKLNLTLKKKNQKISCVLSLQVDKESAIKRILGRQLCLKCGLIFNKYFSPSTKENHSCDSSFLQKRSDDNEKTVIKRFEAYKEKTLPLLNFYNEQNLLHEIGGKGKISDIFEEIRCIIASLKG